MFLTSEGYEKVIELDSIRAIRVFLKLVQLANDEGNIKVTQIELAKILSLKNKANVSVAVSELIEKNFLKKKVENRIVTYYINPKLVVTQKGYEVLQNQYDSLNINFDKIIDELNMEDFVCLKQSQA